MTAATTDYVRAKAGAIILARFPDYKQRNMIARSLEIVRMASPSPADLAEMAQIEAAWAWVKSVRDACAALEVRIGNGESIAIASIEWPQP